jgi:hypothetical protein
VLHYQPRGGGPQQAWRLLPTPQQLYTLPWPNQRRFAQLNDSIFFNGFHHTLNTFRYRNGSTQTVFSGGYEDAQDVLISPTQPIAAIDLSGSEQGIPVFNTQTGDTLYRIPFRSNLGATFSSNGDTLWTVVRGADNNGAQQALIINPANGAVRRSVTLGDYSIISMLRDPAGGRLFLYGVDDDGERWRINLVVLNDRDLTLLGQVQTPGPIGCTLGCLHTGVVSVGMDGVFIVTPIDIFEFDYLQ